MINLGTGAEISIGDLAERIVEVVGRDVTIALDEDRLRPPDSEVERLVADTSKAQRLLGWEPAVDLDEGLRRTIDWLSGSLERLQAVALQRLKQTVRHGLDLLGGEAAVERERQDPLRDRVGLRDSPARRVAIGREAVDRRVVHARLDARARRAPSGSRPGRRPAAGRRRRGGATARSPSSGSNGIVSPFAPSSSSR